MRHGAEAHLLCAVCGATPVLAEDTSDFGYLPGSDCPACDLGTLGECGPCGDVVDDDDYLDEGGEAA